uniref:DNA-directed RNA polymerase I subunit RPA1 n=1 Tax=Strigamia maritima TaxID=126957 RepID=T1JBE4_STRMM
MMIEGEEERKEGLQTILTPSDAQDHLIKIWERESEFLKYLFPILSSISPVDTFIRSVILVPPPRFRPLNHLGDQKYENPQNINLTRIVQTCMVMRHILSKGVDTTNDDDFERSLRKLDGKSKNEKLNSAWNLLQCHVNAVLDNDPNSKTGDKSTSGVKQTIEKKEGLFRQNMMGKRVNYAARSVISPDPYISIEEIGIPEVFAKKLVYPQLVTPFNVNELRQAVINGPDIHPGATMVENSDGTRVRLDKSEVNRTAIAVQLLTPGVNKELDGCKKVYRHVINDDMLLVNRQPTLHKPSIMAHKARVLKGERTLRLHYSNCKTYNADFDGDEMNIHFPQSELAKAEARLIANVSNQFLVPKDGTPLGGLIQDHMISGVLMTVRGRFFKREDYLQLVLKAIPFLPRKIKTLPPAILKPTVLWSGKQILSTVLINLIPKDKPLITLEGVSKIANKSWQKFPPREWTTGGKIVEPDMSEYEVIIRNGQLLCGVLDKAHYGPTAFGLIHCCYELYGGVISSEILSALGRLFNSFIQNIGFSLGSLDIVSGKKADKKRKKAIIKAQKIGYEVAAEALSIQNHDDVELINDKIEAAHFDLDDTHMKGLDMEMKSKTDKLSNQISQIVMPNGLLKIFPENNLQLMVLSGAKGSTVNSMQISCSLGQIELEGRRPSLTPSGRTLPSFRPYDVTPRAGGFVAGRFATGIELQEFFFHCMAGREGLIDTAVKTSRSGYLQRCLIKHLEALHVNYDSTVRDCDGSVIQFLYGEDGLDIQKSTYMQEKQLPFLVKNYGAIYDEKKIKQLKAYTDEDGISTRTKSIMKWKKIHGKETKCKLSPLKYFSTKYRGSDRNELLNMWKNLDEGEKQKYIKKAAPCPAPVVSKLNPDRHFGAIVERLEQLMDDYLDVNPDKLIDNLPGISSEHFKDMMKLKAMHCVCEPGEAVGLLAAQSVGEPSTQMTLNTFHFAGRGDMNVTLGIPRMREILMSASEKIATPSMDIPFRKFTVDKAEEMKLKLYRVYLNQVIDYINITDTLNIDCDNRYRIYKLHFKFLRHRNYRDVYYTTPAKVLQYMEKKFIKALLKVLKECTITQGPLTTNETLKDKRSEKNEDEAEEGKNDEELDENSDEEDEDTAAARSKKQRGDGAYEEKEEEDDVGKETGDDEMDDEMNTVGDELEVMNLDGEDEEKEGVRDDGEYKAKVKDKEKRKRINYVLALSSDIWDYDFDSKKGEWCEISLKYFLSASTVDMMSILQAECKKSIIYQIPDIGRAVLREVNGELYIKTDGANIPKMFEFHEIFDLNRLHCNNIQLVASAYGIEAARRIIVKEIQDVFSVYGIQVDPRHLFLIADYMTFDGTYTGLNRFAMQTNTSPLQQMSFETTMQFLQTATLQDSIDTLKSPSAQLVVGNVVGMGTGSFNLVQNMC